MIQLKQSKFRLPGLERHTEKLFPFYLNYDKPCGELALGENCIKIVSQDKSNSLGVFLEIHRGYYTVARRYEFYFRVAKQYFTNERSE